MNKELTIETIEGVCNTCDTPTSVMCLSTRLDEVMVLCYNCHLDRLVSKRKGIK
jgi:hypothetical protein